MADLSDDEPEAVAPETTVEQMLRLIMDNQEKMEERNTRRFVAMQTTIDAQEARSAAAAAQAGASIWTAPAAPAEGGWLRRIATSAITPNAAAPATIPPAPRPASSAAALAVAALGRPQATAPVPPAALFEQILKARPSATAAAAARATGIAAIAARARARAAPAAPTPIDVDADGDRDEYFDALDEQYDLLVAAPDSEKSLADNFGGHPLPIQHLARFWPRIANFQETTCHYHPTIA